MENSYKSKYVNEIGWIFLYVFAFGISDYFVKKIIKTSFFYILYYILIGSIGLFLIFQKFNFTTYYI